MFHLTIPEAFQSLVFTSKTILGLGINADGHFLPQHVSCIIGIFDVYEPLFRLLLTQSAVFAELKSMALLVPSSVLFVLTPETYTQYTKTTRVD